MNSPFKIFRKHQKGVMVVMVFAALILFGIGDTLLKMVGGPGPQGSKVVVETNIGKLTQLQMHNLMQQRKIVHRFVALAYARSHPEMEKSPFANQILPMVVQRFGFGQISEGQILYAWLHRHEARKLGIVISDKQVEDYIDSFTDRKLSTKKVREILREMQVNSKDLSDYMRDELLAVTAFRMKQPVVVASPEKYWEYYQELNTRQKIEVVELPVKDFTGNVPDPTDDKIAKLFEKHKDDFEQTFEGVYKPGFRQPRRVKLQSLELAFADIEAKARSAGEKITEKEIEEYYETRKALDTRFQEGETGLSDDASPVDPGFAPEKDEKMPKDEPDSDADSKVKDEKPANPAEESSKAPADEPKKPEPKSKEPPSDDQPEAAKPEEKPDCSLGLDDDVSKDAPAESDKPAAKPPADDAAETDKADEKASAAAKPPEKESGTEPAKEPGDDSAKEKEADTALDGPILSPGKAKPHETPKIKFKPLDDDLRDKIRESIIQERARKMMKDQVANAREAMSDVAANFAVSTEVKLTDPDAKQLVELQRRAKDELRKIADKFNMKFGETELVSEAELEAIPGLGLAQEPGSFDRMSGNSTSIREQAFGSDALCRVFESETVDSNIYLCWKVEDAPMHVPELKEPGVREQVIAAWKRLEALPLAEKRAQELAERAQKKDQTKDKSFEEALSGETVTGDAKGTALAVAESKEFSFWREPAAPSPFNRSREEPVQLDDPIVVKKPSRKFMHKVFEEMNEGDVGVALNGDATIYYVVKVLSRRPAEREAFKDVQLFAQNSPYAYLSQIDQQIVLMENDERLREKYAIKWHDVAGRQQGQMQDDD
jgi:hypothetical protein